MLRGIAHQIAAAVDNSRLDRDARGRGVELDRAAPGGRGNSAAPAGRRHARTGRTDCARRSTGVDRCVALLTDDEGNFHVRTVHGLRPGLAEAYAGVIDPTGRAAALRRCLPHRATAGGRRYRGQSAGAGRRGGSDSAVAPSWSCRCWWPTSRSARSWPTMWTAPTCSARGACASSRGIANQAAIAIENARLQSAGSRTRQLLPASWSWPTISRRRCCRSRRRSWTGYEIAYRWQVGARGGRRLLRLLRLGPFRRGHRDSRRVGQGHSRGALHDVRPHPDAGGRVQRPRARPQRSSA